MTSPISFELPSRWCCSNVPTATFTSSPNKTGTHESKNHRFQTKNQLEMILLPGSFRASKLGIVLVSFPMFFLISGVLHKLSGISSIKSRMDGFLTFPSIGSIHWHASPQFQAAWWGNVYPSGEVGPQFHGVGFSPLKFNIHSVHSPKLR